MSCIDKVSLSYRNSLEALNVMGDDGKGVHVVDSEHLSTGMGHLVINAVEMRDSGRSAEEILKETECLKKRISTIFIANNADYLYRNGKVSKGVKNISSTFMVHPVLFLKNGRITLKTVEIGDYGKSIKRFIKRAFLYSKKIDKRRLFITHAGCSVKMISEVKAEVNRLCTFEEVIVTKTSATITSNCGAGTLGVMFIKN